MRRTLPLPLVFSYKSDRCSYAFGERDGRTLLRIARCRGPGSIPRLAQVAGLVGHGSTAGGGPRLPGQRFSLQVLSATALQRVVDHGYQGSGSGRYSGFLTTSVSLSSHTEPSGAGLPVIVCAAWCLNASCSRSSRSELAPAVAGARGRHVFKSRRCMFLVFTCNRLSFKMNCDCLCV